MARPRESGPKRVRKTHSDGTVWYYLYDRKTGEPLGRQPATDEANGAKSGSMAELIHDYLNTRHFRSRKPNTRDDYSRILKYLNEHIGDLNIRALTPAAVQQMKEALAEESPSKANKVLAMLSVLYQFAIQRNRAQSNPAARPGKVPVRKRTEIWSHDDEQRAMEAFSRPALKLAFMLMLYTCQRLSDVLDMTTAQVSERDGRLYITLRQAKTGELVGVPVHARLEPFLRERLAETTTSMMLVVSRQGLRWSRRNFSKAWDTDLAKANATLRTALEAQGLSATQVAEELAQRHRHRHDLRRTGIVRLAEAGAATSQIAALSGHQIDHCQRILDTYLPRRTEVALAGIELWERAGDVKKVVRLADARQRRGA